MAEQKQGRARRGRYSWWLVALFSVGAVATTSIVVACRKTDEPTLTPGAPAAEAPKDWKEFAGQYFRTWPQGQKPELVLLFTGQQHNYEAPCGCTEPQYGGLERRYNFFTQMRGFGLPATAMDLGDIYYTGDPALKRPFLSLQGQLKYRTALDALSVMEYDAVAIGVGETKYPLLNALTETVLNKKYSFDVLAATILNKNDFPSADGPMIKDLRLIEPKGSKLKVGVVAVFGETAQKEAEKNDQSLKFGPNPAALAA